MTEGVAIIVDRSRGRSWRRPNGRSILTAYGLTTVVVSDRPGDHYLDLDASVDLHLVERIDLSTIVDVARLYGDRVCGVTTSSELCLEAVAAARSVLKVPGHSVEYTRNLRDKWEMKRIARGCGIPTASGWLADQAVVAIDALPRDIRYFVKPRNLSGSRGARELGDRRALTAWLGASDVVLSDYLVEEFITGRMYHIDGFIHNGSMTMTASVYDQPTHRAGGNIPLSSHTVSGEALYAQARSFARRVVNAFELREDVFHCEAFLNDDQFVFCEIAGRPGGAGVSEVFEIVRGTDLRWAKTVLDLGLSPDQLPRRLEGSYSSGGWTVVYELPPVESCAGPSGLIYADVRDPHLKRDIGFSGVGAATYVFAGEDDETVVKSVVDWTRQLGALRGRGDCDGC